ncbi:energy-coupling factor transporter transmembrane component T family protein [Spiribacter halobius]|uniref:Energy-coupling factor transporter transmembrane protein EcfT n=1 Tax=Sediminicurvatus halobius TaxID=2182432 RepID=A0A2U2N9J4_9GAMM|nr:energy-coupling factor transporter transmembrane protein EcfT [Spiribacter halobius]PWG65730.1 energy-coupling factor transporter transmembrane protein EcfT [Spiribacter halobius]UEX77765.1 energy-coupling factor transporter transmembrane protein EcfT [Spiribacter halobius]
MIAGLYVPGPSPVHALPAGAKLLALMLLGTVAFAVPSLPVTVAGATVVAALYPLGRVPVAAVWHQARNLAPLLALIALAQAWFDGPTAAALTVARVLGLVWAAGLVTATTPFSEMMAVLERVLAPLRRLGVAPARIAFALTMAVRFVPMLQGMIEEARAAQAARGLRRNPLALAVPLTIRALRLSDRVAEAVEARGALARETDDHHDHREQEEPQ